MCKIHAYQLIPEISRKCNIACKHCLRGPAQRKVMSEDVVERIFEIFDMTQTEITFGGGEPTLALDVIELFVNRLNSLYAFYIVTNGKVYHKKLVELCDKLYNMSEEQEMCGLAFSSDMFHEEFVPYDKLRKNIWKYTINEIEDSYIGFTSINPDYRHLSGSEIVHYPTRQEYRIWNHAKAVDLNNLR